MKTLLTIAGFDPSSGAGMTADLAVYAAHGFFGTSAITALTMQSTVGVAATQAVDAAWLAETLAVLSDDLPPAGIKIGMLASEENVRAVAEYLRRLGRQVPVVLDPVMCSSSGRALLSAAGGQALREELLGWVNVVTPNTAELAVLTGMPVVSRDQVEEASRALCGLVPGLEVVATGGDRFGASDLWVSAAEARWLEGEMVQSDATHGTGCAFASALLCGIVRQERVVDAAAGAKAYVTEAIRSAPKLGSGRGPMELLWPLRR